MDLEETKRNTRETKQGLKTILIVKNPKCQISIESHWGNQVKHMTRQRGRRELDMYNTKRKTIKRSTSRVQKISRESELRPCWVERSIQQKCS